MRDRIIVVGGGFAGLAAGVALAEAGLSVHVVEARPYLGGRARSWVDPHTGSIIDNGQHLFMGCYEATLRFLKTIGTLDRIRFQDALSLRFLDPGGRLTSLEFPKLPAPLHMLLGVARSDAFTTNEKMEVFRLGWVLRSSSHGQKPANWRTVDQWLQELGQSESLRRNFWNLLCIAAMNEDPQIASAALFERVLRLALFRSASDSRLGIARVGLSESYTEAAADYIRSRNGRVDLNRPVRRLLVDGTECRGVELHNGESITADAVVCAIPWFAFGEVLPSEGVRSDRFFAPFGRLQAAPIISINLWFDRPIIELQFAGLRGTMIQWLFNKSRILGRSDHYVSLVVSGAHEHVHRSKEELLGIVLRELGELIPGAREAKLLHSLVVKERQATFSPTCDAESVRPSASTPIRRLYLAGDWTATGLPATIEGAVQSGYAAAEAIVRALPVERSLAAVVGSV